MKKSAGNRVANSIGVIVARFQVAKLHNGHIAMISEVLKDHKEILIVLGVRAGMRTRRDPLTFNERVAMIEESLPEIRFTFRQLQDNPISSDLWSQNLDALIDEAFPGRGASLFGGRDSFIPHYSGKFQTREISQIFPDSGTLARQALEAPLTYDARVALIREMESRPPLMFSTSDLAIVDRTKRQVLLIGKKSHSGKFSFVGGFAEKSDASAVDVARREGREEVLGIGVSMPVYVGAISIKDPRYNGTPDGIMTSFFHADFLGGEPFPGDDADSTHWVPFHELIETLVPWHKPLGELLLKALGETM